MVDPSPGQQERMGARVREMLESLVDTEPDNEEL